MAQNYRKFALESPVAYGWMFGAPTGVEPDDSIRQHSEAAFGVLMNSVLIGQQMGKFRAGEPLPIALSIWAALHGAVALEIVGPRPQPELADAHFASVLDMIETGLAPKPQTR